MIPAVVDFPDCLEQFIRIRFAGLLRAFACHSSGVLPNTSIDQAIGSRAYLSGEVIGSLHWKYHQKVPSEMKVFF
jgi:hypothetical protein